MIYTGVNESKIKYFVKTKIKISEPVWISVLAPSPKFLIFFMYPPSFLRCLDKTMHEVEVTGILHIDRLQTLPSPHSLYCNSRFISNILKKKMKEKRLHKYHPTTPNMPGKDQGLLSNRNATKSQDSKRFYKVPSIRGGLNPYGLYPSELFINRITLPCLLSSGRIRSIC